MQIILLEKVENVGSIGDQVTVKPGYARNYLIPKGKATFATPDNIAKFEAMRADLEKKAADELASAQERAKAFEGLKLEIEVQAGTGGAAVWLCRLAGHHCGLRKKRYPDRAQRSPDAGRSAADSG